MLPGSGWQSTLWLPGMVDGQTVSSMKHHGTPSVPEGHQTQPRASQVAWFAPSHG